jgi:hypothetical protein
MVASIPPGRHCDHSGEEPDDRESAKEAEEDDFPDDCWFGDIVKSRLGGVADCGDDRCAERTPAPAGGVDAAHYRSTAARDTRRIFAKDANGVELERAANPRRAA